MVFDKQQALTLESIAIFKITLGFSRRIICSSFATLFFGGQHIRYIVFGYRDELNLVMFFSERRYAGSI